jgi:hypothetical protein
MKTNMRRLFWWAILIYLIFELLRGCSGTRTVSIVNDTAMAAQNEQEGVKIEQFDPCGLKEVVCEGEEPKGAPAVKFEAKTEIVAKIKAAFPENPEIAVKMASCESSLQVDKLGDEQLAFEHEGELLGRSRGLFQVRTGGKEKSGKVWNRAKANGLTVVEFEKKMINADENIKYARAIYDRAGDWSPWLNCAKMTGAI